MAVGFGGTYAIIEAAKDADTIINTQKLGRATDDANDQVRAYLDAKDRGATDAEALAEVDKVANQQAERDQKEAEEQEKRNAEARERGYTWNNGVADLWGDENTNYWGI